MIRFHLNGWQRVGIVLSVMWAVGGALWMNNIQWQRANVYSLGVGSSCRAGFEVVQPTPSEQAIEDREKRCQAIQERSFNSAVKFKSRDALLAGLVPIPFAWLLVYLVVIVVRMRGD